MMSRGGGANLLPRKVSDQTLGQWRELSAKGNSYREIGVRTGWDERTISKYLQQDIQSAETTDMRRELFKEGLGRHWDLLINRVSEDLMKLKVSDPWDYTEWIEEFPSQEFQMAGARIVVGEQLQSSAQVFAADSREFELLQQHLPGDDLWQWIRDYEAAIVSDLLARHRFYKTIGPYLAQSSGWSFEDDRTEGRPALLKGCVDVVYEACLANAVGLKRSEIASKNFHQENGGSIILWSKPIAFAPGQIDTVNNLIVNAISELTVSSEAIAASGTYDDLKRLVTKIRRGAEDLRLLPYLPRVCSLCGRVKV